MQRYYQKGEFSEWILARDDNPHEPWILAKAQGACKVTILALEGDPDILGFDKMKYSGPLFFDIDDGQNLEKAINSGIELCEKLMSLDVDENDLEIHLSGSKGIHVFIHPKIFSKGEPTFDLFNIHRRMALALYVPGMDMQVYSGRKGRQVRPPDSRRDDGKYKVPVTFAELKNLTVEEYKEKVAGPSGRPPFSGPCKHAKTLASLMVKSKTEPKDVSEAQDKESSVSDLSPLEGITPPCVEELAKGNRNTAASFNQVALNVACWSGNYPTELAIVESLHTRIVENCPSSKGEKGEVRRRRMMALHAYVAGKNSGYQFSCGAMLKTISTKPCGSCPMKVAISQATGISAHLFIQERNGQWYSDQDCTNVITTFTIERDAVIKDEGTKIIQSAIVDLVVPAQGRLHRIHDFDEAAWQNKSSFKTAIQGIDGAIYLGNDNDLARIRLTLAKNELLSGAEMKEQYKSPKIGIIYRRRSGPASAIAADHLGRLTYVEKDFSANSSWIYGTHRYAGAEQPGPQLGRLDWSLPISPEANEAFGLLLQCNLSSVIAPMLGWYLLAHLKTHVYQIEHRGALMCVSGVAGTGKNSLTAVMQRLVGLQGEDALYTLEAPNSTKLPFQQALSNTTTIPRVINELNPKSVTKNQYRDLMELLKASFDSQSISRGRIGGNTDKDGANVSTVSWQITAPVITLSEEPIGLPAIRQRAVMVDMTPQGHDFGSKAFFKLEREADALVDIARVLVKGALNTSVKEVYAMMKATEMPEEMEYYDIPSRLKFGYSSILLAYDWAIRILGECDGFSKDNVEGLRAMRVNFIDYMRSNSQRIARDSNVTEVDKVIKDFAVMAYSSGDTRSVHTLEKPKHFVMTPDTLYLDIPVIYPLYQRFKAGSPEPMSIVSAEAFLQTVRSMSYYISDQAVTDLMPTNGRRVLALDVEKMMERDIPTTMFL